jgi:hypothetical protein
MSRYGFALCSLGKKWEFLSLNHSCPRFTETTKEVADARMVWAGRFK